MRGSPKQNGQARSADDVRQTPVRRRSQQCFYVVERRINSQMGFKNRLRVSREKIYQSHVSKWGRQIDDGTLGTVRPGPAATGKDPAKVRVRELEAQLRRAREKISTLEELVTAQGKCLALHVDVRLDDSANSQAM